MANEPVRYIKTIKLRNITIIVTDTGEVLIINKLGERINYEGKII